MLNNKNYSPTITVFMPVYNGEKYLPEAVESILNQTFKDFELLIIDDGSTDKSMDIIRSFKDERIISVQNEKNLGIAATRNRGLELARGKYIVPMDCDDISLPARLEKQYKFMEENQDVGICGTWYEIFGENLKKKIVKLPETHEEIKPKLFFVCPVLNSTCIMRKKLLDKFNLKFDENYPIVIEDYDLILRSSFFFKLANLPEVLFKYRMVQTGATKSTKKDEKKKYYIKFLTKNIGLFDIEANQQNLQIYYYLNKGNFPVEESILIQIKEWLENLQKINIAKKIYDEPYFSQSLASVWLGMCSNASVLGIKAYRVFWSSKLLKHNNISVVKIIKFTIKCLLCYNKNQINPDTSIIVL